MEIRLQIVLKLKLVAHVALVQPCILVCADDVGEQFLFRHGKTGVTDVSAETGRTAIPLFGLLLFIFRLPLLKLRYLSLSVDQ